ncbi:MAG: SAM-dependent methyltransferase [Spirochaetota bacterium]|nr:SAM-dependent methyltransferase [Spirochaetota bacterium]
MPFTLEKIVPWGRSFDEYVKMFNLTKQDLKLSILGCADGPSSFNHVMNKLGNKVTSIDPIYQFSKQQIESRIEASYEKVMDQMRQNANDYVWDSIESLEMLGQIRMTAMKEFISDFDTGKIEGRYFAECLPSLSFQDKQFDIALCSHFLFLYSDQLSLDFHLDSIQEMYRTAKEVRIFPLLDLGCKKSPFIDIILEKLEQSGYIVEIIEVPYQFQCGGNEMMRICR